MSLPDTAEPFHVPLPDAAALEARLPRPSDVEEPMVPLHCVDSVEAATGLFPERAEALARWAKVQGFTGAEGQVLALPDPGGALQAILVGCTFDGDGRAMPGFGLGVLPGTLPAGTYSLKTPLGDAPVSLTAFLLGGYQFSAYRADTRGPVALATDDPARGRALTEARGVIFARDLINTPANRLGPEALATSAAGLASTFGAAFSVIEGEALLDPSNPFPMIHTVGAAAKEAPRLVDLRWQGSGAGDGAPRITLVGKGVCFDSGGLNIKPGNSMALMKKDMGGAAAVLGLALMIMQANLPVRLRVLVPAVENAIASQAFRPGDVLASRKGLSVEIGNTDAEGRLILGDALALADEEAPDLLIDMATLTGAARVALGPDLPPFFTDDETLAEAIAASAQAVDDPVWRMPLWPRYEQTIKGKVGDISNTGSMPFAGAITAALFLKRFVDKAPSWVHFDIYGWTPSPRPGRPEGGEPQAIRALFNLVATRHGTGD